MHGFGKEIDEYGKTTYEGTFKYGKEDGKGL